MSLLQKSPCGWDWNCRLHFLQCSSLCFIKCTSQNNFNLRTSEERNIIRYPRSPSWLQIHICVGQVPVGAVFFLLWYRYHFLSAQVFPPLVAVDQMNSEPGNPWGCWILHEWVLLFKGSHLFLCCHEWESIHQLLPILMCWCTRTTVKIQIENWMKRWCSSSLCKKKACYTRNRWQQLRFERYK